MRIESHSMGRKLTCFMIDDDLDDQEVFLMAAKEVSKSIDCVFANDCIDALEKLNGEKAFIPNYIFIDINMPRLNGIDCLKEVKKLEYLKRVPVYMYSTSADPKFIAESRKLGATDFIIKPTSFDELIHILSGVLHDRNYAA